MFNEFKAQHPHVVRMNSRRTTIIEPCKSCLKQGGSVECGYFTLCFMRDIIDKGLLYLQTKQKYSQNDIDDLRVSWGDFISNNVDFTNI